MSFRTRSLNFTGVRKVIGFSRRNNIAVRPLQAMINSARKPATVCRQRRRRIPRYNRRARDNVFHAKRQRRGEIQKSEIRRGDDGGFVCAETFAHR